MLAGVRGSVDGFVTSGNDCGYLAVIADRANEYGPVFINWVPVGAEEAIGQELRKVQYGNPAELSLVAFAYATFTTHEALMRQLARFRISNRNWFVRSTSVERLINWLKEGNGED